MEFIFTDADRKDRAIFFESFSLDLETGEGTNDEIVITIPARLYKKNDHKSDGYIYSTGTEYGGIFTHLERNVADGSVKLRGRTWRGLLDTRITIPPAGQDYLIVSGDLNACIRTLLGTSFESLYTVSEEVTKNVTYQVPRFYTVRRAIEDMLDDNGYRLSIKAVSDINQFSVELSAVPIVDYSEDVEISEDSDVKFSIVKPSRKYTHIVAAGKGELKDRLVVLYEITAKSIKEVTAIPDGIDKFVYFLDYPNAESKKELTNEAKKTAKEINTNDSQDVTVDGGAETYEIGDIVGGRDYLTGIKIKEAITQKIVRYKRGYLSIEFKVGG